LGTLKGTVYARMEEMSFRSGAAVAGGVLAAAGVAVTLAVLLGGHSDAATSAPAPDAAVGSVAPASSAPASASPSVTPRASRTPAPATAAGTYQPSSQVSASATPHPTATPVPGRTTPWHPMRPLWSSGQRPGQPGSWGWPGSQPEPWPWGL
jgi:hypothetical protein